MQITCKDGRRALEIAYEKFPDATYCEGGFTVYGSAILASYKFGGTATVMSSSFHFKNTLLEMFADALPIAEDNA